MAHTFTHLRVHSHYSILDGVLKLPELVQRAREYQQTSLALTDVGALFGMMEFRKLCQQASIQPILGCEFHLAQDSRFDKNANPSRLVLLCQSEEGYRNLIHLSTLSYEEGFYRKPQIDLSLLSRHHQGLILLSGASSGVIGQALVQQEPLPPAWSCFMDLFGSERFFLEITRCGHADEDRLIQSSLELAKKHTLKLVATNDVYYLDPEDAILRQMVTATRRKRRLADLHTHQGGQYLRSTAEMAALFAEVPDALTNTQTIAEQCQFQLDTHTPHLPIYPLTNAETADSCLRNLALQGLSEHLGSIPEAYTQRLDRELAMIATMGFANYFLVVADFIAFARRMGIFVGPGRGSVAGSLVAYATRITSIDPLRYDLLFERFLNPDRVSMPDIDTDFQFDRRDEVKQYLRARYGYACTADVITFGYNKSKGVLKDVGRALNIPIHRVNQVTKLIDHRQANTPLSELLENAIDLKQVYAMASLKHMYQTQPSTLPAPQETVWQIISDTLQMSIVPGAPLPEQADIEGHIAKQPQLQSVYAEASPIEKDWFQYAARLDGTIRNIGTHASAMIISNDPLIDVIPVYSDPSGTRQSQFDGDYLESNGLLKMDILGLKNLTMIQHCIEWIERRHHRSLDPERFPLDDAQVFALFCRGSTAGVFQFESEGMTQYLKELRPNHISDLIAMNALYRPGPMDNIPEFIARKHGISPVDHFHADLEGILSPTYGIIVYQEQVMQIAQVLAGFSLGEADLIRRAMAKKKEEELQKIRPTWIAGCLKRGYTQELAERIFDLLVPFSNYAFNKSHSVAYSILAYQTAYLKAHYPIEFMAALLRSVQESSDDCARYIDACEANHIPIFAVDVNYSEKDFGPEGSGVRFGLAALKGLAADTIHRILQDRRAKGLFQDYRSFVERMSVYTEVKKSQIEILLFSGALDGLLVPQPRDDKRLQEKAIAWHNLSMLFHSQQEQLKDKQRGELQLFGEESKQLNRNIPALSAYLERAEEIKIYGFDFFRRTARALPTLSYFHASIQNLLPANTPILLLGLLSDVEIRFGRGKRPFARLNCVGVRHHTNLYLFDEAYEQNAHHLQAEAQLERIQQDLAQATHPQTTVRLQHAILEAESNALRIFGVRGYLEEKGFVWKSLTPIEGTLQELPNRICIGKDLILQHLHLVLAGSVSTIQSLLHDLHHKQQHGKTHLHLHTYFQENNSKQALHGSIHWSMSMLPVLEHSPVVQSFWFY